MRKNFLFTILAIFLAWAWFGGISMAETTDTESETSTESTTCTANCVAKIWEIQYATLAEAIEAALDWDTVTLLRNVESNEALTINKNLNIDLWWNTHTLAISVNWAKVQIKNWTINDINGNRHWTIASDNGAEITLISTDTEPLTVNSTEMTLTAWVWSKLTIEWWTYTANDNCVIWTNWSAWQWWNTITINWWTFNGYIQSNWYIACWIYAPNDDTITVNWWTFNVTNGVWVAIRAWKVTISDQAEFNVTWDSSNKGKVWDSRVVIPAGTKVAVDLAAKYPWLKEDFSVKSKKNSKETQTMNQLYIIEQDQTEGTAYADADDIEITKKSWEYKVEIQWWTFSKDVTENTAEGMCSIKNSDWKYVVETCPTDTKFDMSTNIGITIPVVLNEGWNWLLLNETIAVLKKDWKTEWALYAALTAEGTTQDNLNDAAKVVEVLWQKLLFFKQPIDGAWHYKIWVFNEKLESNWPFSDRTKFIWGTAYNSENPTITFDSESGIEDPFTVSSWDIKTYNEIQKDSKTVWYTLYVEKDWNNGWFYAPRMYKITFDVNGGVWTYEAQKVALTGWKATNPWIPTKEWSWFKFWSLSNDEESATEYDFNTVVTGDITLYAMYGDDAFTITWKNWNDIINTGTFASWAMPAYVWDAPSKDADSTCNAYEFKEWTPSVTAVTDEATYTATFSCTSPKSSKSSWGWGGGGSSKTTKSDDTKATTWDNAKVDENNIENNNEENVNEENKDGETVATMTDAQAVEKFGQEQIDAYKWALENGITTMKTVESARLDEPLTRAELAKMMVVYIQKVLEKDPIVTGDVTYPDVDESLGDLYGYIKLAYQYQIMWINADGTPIEFFNPYGIVTRWEYATVFSRVLFGDKFNKDGEDFYSKHLEALKAAWILTNTIPTIHEMRGWVMLMMYRSSQNTEAIEKVANTTEATEEESSDETVNEEKASEENENTEESTANNNEEVATENAEETTEAEATEVATWDVAEATAAEASTWDVATN